MRTSLSRAVLDAAFARLGRDAHKSMPVADRQPVHVFYGGAHLFRAGVARKLGDLALRALEEFAPSAAEFGGIFGIDDTAIAATVRERVLAKLEREPVEDFRIDFEDGYGVRSHDEEDAHAVAAAREIAAGADAGTLPLFTGIRIKPLTTASRERAARTLDLLITALAGRVPRDFRITLPKVGAAEEVAALAGLCDELEAATGLHAGALRIEIMAETPAAFLSSTGELGVSAMAAAARGRCIGAHFGIFDFTSALGVAGASQHLLHPAGDFARILMLTACAPAGIAVADSITNIFPIPRFPGDRDTVHRAWRIHYRHVRHALDLGIYQGWDLHPGQLVARYAAVYAFFHEGLEDAASRLRNFLGQAAQATRVGEVFDDAATGLGLVNYFARAMNCGALTESEAAERSGLTPDQLRAGTW